MSTLSSVISTISNVIKGNEKPVQLLPAALLLCTSLRRPGISAMDITAEYIRLNGRLGIPTGVNTDGSPNLINASAYALIDTLVKNLKMNGAVSVAIEPGSLTCKGVATGPSGAMDVTVVGPIGISVQRGTVQ